MEQIFVKIIKMQINIDNYLKKFEVHEADTLFDLTFEELRNGLKEMKCPVCGRRLKQTLNKKIYYCKNVNHKKFVITSDKYNKIVK